MKIIEYLANKPLESIKKAFRKHSHIEGSFIYQRIMQAQVRVSYESTISGGNVGRAD